MRGVGFSLGHAPPKVRGVRGVEGCRIHSSENRNFILETGYSFYPPYPPQFFCKALSNALKLGEGCKKFYTPFLESYPPSTPLTH